MAFNEKYLAELVEFCHTYHDKCSYNADKDMQEKILMKPWIDYCNSVVDDFIVKNSEENDLKNEKRLFIYCDGSLDILIHSSSVNKAKIDLINNLRNMPRQLNPQRENPGKSVV